jgi:hypothetical protein
VEIPAEVPGLPVHSPNHVSFPESAVLVPIPAAPTLDPSRVMDIPLLEQESGEDFRVAEGDSDCSGFQSVNIAPTSVPVILQDGELKNSKHEEDNFGEFRHWNVRHDKFEAAVVALDPKAGVPVSSHEVNDVGVCPAPSRRPVRQRWFYEPVSAVVESVPTRSKRVSKQPQRLTSSRLGEVVSVLPQSTALLSRTSSFLTNKESSFCSSSGSDEYALQATNGELLSSGSTGFSFLASTGFEVSTNQGDSEIVEICALCADKPDAVGLGGASDLDTDNEVSPPGSSVTSTDPMVPQVLSTSPGERFSVGDGTRTGRFVIRLTFQKVISLTEPSK